MSSPLPPADQPLCVRPACDLTPQDLAWLWPGRLALGKLAMLDGDPGMGKSLIALDLCARLSTGRPWPDGSPGPGPADCIYLNGEDGHEDTVLPRLRAFGADLSRVHVRNDPGGKLLRLPSELGRLGQALAQTRSRFLVVDPLLAFLDANVVPSSDQSVRQALSPVAEVAARHACAALLHRHLNKEGGSHALYRGGGSIGFIAACRSGWLAARDPVVRDRCVLAEVKNNLAARQPSLAYQVVRQEGAPPALHWLGPSLWTADQLLAGTGSAAAQLARARDFLATVLRDGARTSDEVWTAAREYALSTRTLNRAKKELGGRSQRVMVDGRQVSYWLLPGQRLPETVRAASPTPELDEFLENLERQYPSINPLDEAEDAARNGEGPPGDDSD
jgi:hypothetical protein